MSDHELFCDIPIIVISGADHLDGLEAAFTAGATDYITKPPSHTELLARIRSALRLKTEMNQRKAREEDLLVLNDRLAEMNRELERLSTTDSLTGLANRRSFNEFLSREWLREQRERQPFSVVMIDIDHFKNYNDHYGHLEGDICLQKVAWALQAPFVDPVIYWPATEGKSLSLSCHIPNCKGLWNWRKTCIRGFVNWNLNTMIHRYHQS
jgi:PleD family two-component response regulator